MQNEPQDPEVTTPSNEPLEPTSTTEETKPEQEDDQVPAAPEAEGKPVGEATIVDMETPADLFPPQEEQA